MKDRLSLKEVLFWVLGTAFLFNGTLFLGWQLFRNWKKGGHCQDPITIMVQTGPQREALPTAYLAELMGLSRDKPTLSSHFDKNRAKARLLSSPVIKQADVHLIRPGIVYVDYTTRQPMALLAEYENTALDREGYAFPLSPFFPPKNLPEITLGLKEPLHWKHCLQSPKLKLAFSLLDMIQNLDLFKLKRIDVSRSEEKSYGRREIILVVEDEIQKEGVHYLLPRLLRLSHKEYAKELGNYLQLRTKLLEKEQIQCQAPHTGQTLLYCPRKVIDLRIPQLAFIEGDKNYTQTN